MALNAGAECVYAQIPIGREGQSGATHCGIALGQIKVVMPLCYCHFHI